VWMLACVQVCMSVCVCAPVCVAMHGMYICMHACKVCMHLQVWTSMTLTCVHYAWYGHVCTHAWGSFRAWQGAVRALWGSVGLCKALWGWALGRCTLGGAPLDMHVHISNTDLFDNSALNISIMCLA
jgi:hypothetical protein